MIEIVQTETESLRPAFSKINPKLQLYIDSVSLGAFKKCPRFYELSIVEGYTLPGTNSHLEFGILMHSSVEVYQRNRHNGIDHETALLATFRYALLATWNFDHKRPWVSDEPTKTRNTLLRTLVVYLDRIADDSLETLVLHDGSPAIEQGFQIDLQHYASTGETFSLCGRIDRGATLNGQVWTPDLKTTKYALDDLYFTQYSPHNQVSLYSVAGRAVLHAGTEGVIIDAIQLLAGGSRFRRQPIERTTEQLEEWLHELAMWLDEMDLAAKRGYWKMNDTACGYGRNHCTFRGVCSADPSARQEILDAFYVRRFWDPLGREAR